MNAELSSQLPYFYIHTLLKNFFKLHIPGCLSRGLPQQVEIRCGFAGNCYRGKKRIEGESEVLKPM